MDGLIVSAALFVLFLFVGAIGGVISFFRMNKMSSEIKQLNETVDELGASKETLEFKLNRFSAIIRKNNLQTDFSEPADENLDLEAPRSGSDPDQKQIDEAEKQDAVEENLVNAKDSQPEENKPEKLVAAKVQSGEELTTSEKVSDVDNDIEEPIEFAGRVEDRRNLEETLGSLWAVWVGGIALALGAVFLVKYSIEAGLLGPKVRILMGLVFSAFLVLLGEWARRRGSEYSFAGFSKANVPAILTAAGTLGAFGSVYAAYELYNLIPPAVAFIALAIVAVATTFASLLHGPLLAGLGSLGSFIAPLLISTEEPSLTGLAAYIIAVAASGFAVGRLRLWKWLAIATSVGLMAYAFLLHQIVSTSVSGDRLILTVYLFIAWFMIAYVFVMSLYQRDMRQFEFIDYTASILLGLMLAFIPVGAQVAPADALSVLILLAITGAPFALATWFSASRIVVYASMFMAVIGYLGWSIDLKALYALEPNYDVEAMLSSFVVREQLAAHAWIGAAMAGLAALIGFWGSLNSVSRAALAIGGGFLPILLFSTHYLRVAEFSSSYSYAFVALVLFAGNFFVSNSIYQRLGNREQGRDHASAAYAVAAIVALALSVSLVLEKAALTIALAMLVPAIAYINHLRPLPALRPLAVLASLLWVGRILWEPRIIDGDLGATPIFNWLTYGYGIPTLGFILASWLLFQSRRDKWLEYLEVITLTSVAATLALVGLHAIDPAEVFTEIDTLEEVALITLIGCGLAIALIRINQNRRSRVLRHGATILGLVGMISGAFGLLFLFNPLLDGRNIGSNLLWNKLAYAYLLTGLLYAWLGRKASGIRPRFYVLGANILGALLLANWVNSTIRQFYQGGEIGLFFGSVSDGEIYTYSVVWLLIGILILTAGIKFLSKPLRLVSVGVFVLVVAKVFLIDMSGLQGFLRALSFIGLGGTLIAIGLVYQKVLSRLDHGLDEETGRENPDAEISTERS